jgi:23S rRNA pseudouridine1911/1915/1917 synthase
LAPKFQTHRVEFPPEQAGRRLDVALAALLPQYSRTRIQRWIDEGAVLVNGLAVKPRDVITGGETATVEARIRAETGIKAEKLPLDIVHKDAAIIVINKPPGLVVHPGAGNREHTLQNALLAHDKSLKTVPRAGLVHRIDKDTSGLLVVARTLEAHSALVALLAAHEIEREYLAVCTGAMTGGGTVDEPIGRHRTQRIKMAVRRDGREAVTHYRIEKRFRAHTLARVRLETGRTHQIRVHLAHVGYPIVGDPVYGGRKKLPAGASPELVAALNGFQRQALHAARLSFSHPKSGKAVSYEAPLPDDLRGLLDALARDGAGARE